MSHIFCRHQPRRCPPQGVMTRRILSEHFRKIFQSQLVKTTHIFIPLPFPKADDYQILLRKDVDVLPVQALGIVAGSQFAANGIVTLPPSYCIEHPSILGHSQLIESAT